MSGISLKHLSSIPTNASSLVLPIAASALAMVIFAFDTLTNLEIAVDALYVVVVLMSASFCPKRGVVLVSLGCMALTISSFFLTSNGSLETGLINDGIGLVVIAASTFLALRTQVGRDDDT